MKERFLIDGQKLATLRAEQYLTQAELAGRLGMSVAGVRRLEQIEQGGMQFRNFRRLAEVSRISLDDLRRRIGVPPTFRPTRVEPLASTQPTALLANSLQRVGDIRQFHGVSASRAEDRAEVSRGQVPAPVGGGRRFAAVVDGDCMEPAYRNGDVVIFSIDLAECEGVVDGRNYFIQLTDGENTFKRLFVDREYPDRLVLRCWNPKYPDRSIGRDRIHTLARAQFRLVPDESPA